MGDKEKSSKPVRRYFKEKASTGMARGGKPLNNDVDVET